VCACARTGEDDVVERGVRVVTTHDPRHDRRTTIIIIAIIIIAIVIVTSASPRRRRTPCG
jgi:hypothetical protein